MKKGSERRRPREVRLPPVSLLMEELRQMPGFSLSCSSLLAWPFWSLRVRLSLAALAGV